MWKPICKTGLTGVCPAYTCLLKGRCCANSTAVQRRILPFSFPNGGGKISSEAGMKHVRDYGFSKENNADILVFAKASGLRRHELAAIRLEQIKRNSDGSETLCAVKGKGGKVRDIDVLSGKEEAVLKFAGNPTGKPVFASVPSYMDVHSCRREYAKAM